MSSWARRVRDDVRVVVTLSGDLHDRVGDALGTEQQVWLRLSRKVDGEPQRLRVPVEVTPGDRPVVTATVPLASVPHGTWNLALRVGQGGPVVPLEARLLTTDTAVQPLALLAGPKPTTRLPEPTPR
ncbi:MAG: hypothetical protein JWN84_4610 [Nocardioides sp.]|nr:hypothetical protein [Nocardioides sp.]